MLMPLKLLVAVFVMAVSGMLSLPVRAQSTDDRDVPARVRALVVGVDSYAKLDSKQQLPRASEDARGLQVVLVESLKVPKDNVRLLLNPDLKTLRAAWTEHVDRLKSNDVSLFFFSGHGAQQDKEPFLLAADYETERAPASMGVAIVDLINKLKATGRKNLGVFIIDACRSEVTASSGSKFTENADGFAPVRAAQGTFIFYAASANQIALHDLGPGDSSAYSVYTRALLPLLKDPRKGLHEIAKDVRWETYQLALERKDREGLRKPYQQIPAYFDEVLERRNLLGTALPRVRATIDASVKPGPVIAGAKGLWVCRSCPEMVEIPAPSSPRPVRGASSAAVSDAPSAGQQPKAFAIGKYEVTRDEWRACQMAGRCRTVDDEILEGDRRPITGVSWNDAASFIAWLNESSGQNGFRLPSEAEWEHAAQGGGTSDYGPANDVRQLCDYANGADASLKTILWANPTCNDGKDRGVTTAGSYRPNLYGVHDMQGNVWEWVEECSDLPSKSSGGSASGAERSAACEFRVAKGGSWRSGPDALKISSFQLFAPGSKRSTVGFRVARDLPD